MLYGEETGTKTAATPLGDPRDDGPRRVRFQVGHRIPTAVHRSHVGETLQASRIRHHIQAQR